MFRAINRPPPTAGTNTFCVAKIPGSANLIGKDPTGAPVLLVSAPSGSTSAPKSFGGQSRVHTFSLRQVRPGPAVRALVVSIRAERSSGGITILNLVSILADRGISVSARDKVSSVIAQSLGNTASSGLALTFDFERARESVRYFGSGDVPSVSEPLPAGVLRVRFDALLNEQLSVPIHDLESRGPLFSAALPK